MIILKPHGKTGWQRLFCAFQYSKKGLIEAFKTESAFRQECALAFILIPLGLWLGQDALSRALLVASILQILIVEILNSALEVNIRYGSSTPFVIRSSIKTPI